MNIIIISNVWYYSPPRTPPLSSLDRNLNQAVPINNTHANKITKPLTTANTSPLFNCFFVTLILTGVSGTPDNNRPCREDDWDGERRSGICCSGEDAEAERDIRKLILLFLPMTGCGSSFSHGESSSAGLFPPSGSTSSSSTKGESKVFCNRSVVLCCWRFRCLNPKIPNSWTTLSITKAFKRYCISLSSPLDKSKVWEEGFFVLKSNSRPARVWNIVDPACSSFRPTPTYLSTWFG